MLETSLLKRVSARLDRLSALEKQCLREHTPDEAVLREQVEPRQRQRNQREVVVNWQFTTADARIKLRRLYPQVQT